MAWIKATVGDGTSGADFAIDVGALQAWWDTDVEDEVAGDYEAEIISDITDDVNFSGATVGAKNLWIHGNSTGETKWAISTPSNTVLGFVDALIGEITIEDLHIECSGQTVGDAIFISSGGTALTMRRMIVSDSFSEGVRTASNSQVVTILQENVIIRDCLGVGFVFGYSAGASTAVLRNCIAVRNVTGFAITNSTNVTISFYNCIAFDNTTIDFQSTGLSPTVTVDSCVSSDSSATNASYDTVINTVINKTDTATYFTACAGGEFTLAQSGFDNWGINGSATETPATDFSSVTRSTDDVGPYEFIPAISEDIDISAIGFDILGTGVLKFKDIEDSTLTYTFGTGSRYPYRLEAMATTILVGTTIPIEKILVLSPNTIALPQDQI